MSKHTAVTLPARKTPPTDMREPANRRRVKDVLPVIRLTEPPGQKEPTDDPLFTHALASVRRAPLGRILAGAALTCVTALAAGCGSSASPAPTPTKTITVRATPAASAGAAAGTA